MCASKFDRRDVRPPALGFSTAFCNARFSSPGAKTCIARRWKVDDAATQVLMKEFHRNLWQKRLGKREPLRQAQLTMLHQYDPGRRKLLPPHTGSASARRTDPFYWAAFVLSGDWR
jgi:CHAT domain-containing protein